MFKGAEHGNYDLYILFIEMSLKLLNQAGIHGMILPHKFFTAEYGIAIRNLLWAGKNVRQINDFTTNQIFENATTYTCLLFLSKETKEQLLYQKIELNNNPKESLISPFFETISIEKLQDKWNFSSSEIQVLIDKLTNENKITLASISRKIFKGSSTGNDEVYLLEEISKNNKLTTVYSRILDKNIQLENELLKPFIYGQDVRMFFVAKTKMLLLFPYKIVNDKVNLISYATLKKDYPLAANYFNDVKDTLLARKLDFSKNDFYKFSAGRSLSEYNQKKILIPDMLVENRIAIDTDGIYYHGPAIHSFVINEQFSFLDLRYVTGILASQLFWFFISNTSTALRGNTYRLTPEYINPFPVKIIDIKSKSGKTAHDNLVSLVDKMLELKQKEAAEPNQQLKTMITRQIEGVDKAIDTAVYKLYNLTEEEINLVEGQD